MGAAYLTGATSGAAIADAGATTIDSGSLTVSGTNRCMYVVVGSSDNTALQPSSVVWDPTGANQSLTQVGTTITPTVNGKGSVWRLIAPATGTGIVRVTWGGSQSERVVLPWLGTGIDQTTPNGTVQQNSGTSGSAVNSPAVTTSVGQLVFAAGYLLDTSGGTTAFNSPTGTERGEYQTSPGFSSCVDQDFVATGTSTTMSWTLSAAYTGGWGIWAFALNDAATGGGSNPPLGLPVDSRDPDLDFALLDRQIWAPNATALLAGGTTYNVSISETASASDSVDAQLQAVAAIAESASAADQVSSSADLVASLSESASAADQVSSSADLVVSISEAGSAADVVSLDGNVYSVSISETASAADSVSAQLDASATVAETASAADSFTSQAVVFVDVSEAAAASDSFSATGGAQVTPPPAGKIGNKKKQRYVVAIDGETFEVGSAQEATNLLDQARRIAEDRVQQVLEQRKSSDKPSRKEAKALRQSLPVPTVKVVAPRDDASRGLARRARELEAYVRTLYSNAIETGILLRRIEEDEDEALLALLI